MEIPITDLMLRDEWVRDAVAWMEPKVRALLDAKLGEDDGSQEQPETPHR